MYCLSKFQYVSKLVTHCLAKTIRWMGITFSMKVEVSHCQMSFQDNLD